MDLPARPAQQAGEIVQALHVPELKAWMQAKDRPDTPTTPPTQVPAAPVQPTEPNGQPTWLVVSLGGWRRRWRSSLDWPCWPPGARTAGLGRARDLSTVTVTPPDGAVAPTGSPIALMTLGCSGLPGLKRIGSPIGLDKGAQ
jgi:hypothetical protein